jgi:hypothetical protein
LIVQTEQRDLYPGAERLALGEDPERDRCAVVINVPGREVVQWRERRTVPSGDPVGDEREHAEPDGERELPQIGLELSVCGGDVGLLAAGSLELDDADWQSVAVEHDVEATPVLAADHGHLVGDEPVVVVRFGADEAGS